MKIPKKEQEYLDRFYMFVAKIFVILNLKKKEIIKFKKDFEKCVQEVTKAYEDKKYNKAHNLMAEFVLKLQLKRDDSYAYIQTSISKSLLTLIEKKK